MAENVDIRIRNAVEGVESVRKAAQRIRELGGDATKTQTQADGLEKELSQLGNQQALINQFTQVKRELGQTDTQLVSARQRAAELGKQYNATERPTAKLTREFQRARKEVRELDQRHVKQRQTLQQLRGSMDQAGISTTDLAGAQERVTRETRDAKTRMDALRGSTDKAETEMRQSSQAAEQMRRDFERIGVKPFQDVEKEVGDVRQALNRMRQSGQLSGRELQRATQGANQRIKELRGTSDRTAGSVGRLRGAVVGLAGGLLGGVGLVAGIRAAASVSATFEQSMSKVQVITRATGEELQRLEDLAREMGATTSFSATQAADGIQFLGRAGFDTSQIISALPATLSLAAAEGLELGNAADITSNILSGFNMEAERTGEVADILVRASQSANTNVQQLGSAMATAAPIASSLGFDVGETAAAIGVLSNAGIQGQRAGTGLRSVLASLSDVTPKAEKALDDLGLTAEQVNPQTNSLAEVINRLRDGGLDASAAFQIFGREAAPAVLALVEQSDSLADLNSKLRESGGAAEEAAEKMRDNLLGDVAELGSVASEAAIALGDQGLNGKLRELVQTLTGQVRDNTEDVARRIAAAFDLITGAGKVMAGGLRTIFNGVQITIGNALAVLVTRAAETADALSSITFGGLSENFRNTAANLRQTSRDIRNGITEDMEDVFAAGQLAREGALQAANGLAELGRGAESAGDQATETAAEIRTLDEELDALTDKAGTATPTIRTLDESLDALASKANVAASSQREAGSAAQEQGIEVRTLNEELDALVSKAPDVSSSLDDVSKSHRDAANAAREQAAAQGSAEGRTARNAMSTVAGRSGPDDGPILGPQIQGFNAAPALTGRQQRLLSSDERGLVEALHAEQLRLLRENPRDFGVTSGAAGAIRYSQAQNRIFEESRARADALIAGERGAEERLRRDLGIDSRSPETTGARRQVDVNLNLGGESIPVQTDEANADRLMDLLANARALTADGA